MAVAAKLRQDERAFLTRDTDIPPGLRPSSSVAQVFALGSGDDQSGEALVSFAVASEALRAEPGADGGTGYSIAFHVVAHDSATSREVRLDTLRHFVSAQPLEPGQYLTSQLEVGLPPGRWTVAVRAEQPGGSVALNDRHVIQVDGAAAIQLSDIVTGVPGAPDWVATDNAEFPVNYRNAWHSGEAVELFFEVRGVPSGKSYRTTVAVRPAGGSTRNSVEVRGSEVGAGSVGYVRKTLSLQQLVPGTYRLIITVEYGGQRATRERDILLIGR
jgi:hypothetical protein